MEGFSSEVGVDCGLSLSSAVLGVTVEGWLRSGVGGGWGSCVLWMRLQYLGMWVSTGSGTGTEMGGAGYYSSALA